MPSKNTYVQQHTCPTRNVFQHWEITIFNNIGNKHFQQHARVGQHT